MKPLNYVSRPRFSPPVKNATNCAFFSEMAEQFKAGIAIAGSPSAIQAVERDAESFAVVAARYFPNDFEAPKFKREVGLTAF